MNFSYGIIGIVGVLAAISIVFISMDPGDIIEPRVVVSEERPTVCTMQWDPMCGVDGVTYGNMCMLDAADAELDYQGECVMGEPVEEISVNPSLIQSTAIAGDVLTIEVEFRGDDGTIVDHVNYDIFAIQDENSILSEPGSHRHPGKHPIHETIVLSESPIEIQVIVQGLGHGDEITGPKDVETLMTIIPEAAPGLVVEETPEPVVEETPEPVVEETSEPQSLPSTTIVSIPAGVAVPGCEETNECYLPYEVTISSGSSVSWINDDSAAHTVTSGTVTAGITGVFDSSLFMAGATFEHTFDEAGTFDYFCMVHPWMTGIVNVN